MQPDKILIRLIQPPYREFYTDLSPTWNPSLHFQFLWEIPQVVEPHGAMMSDQLWMGYELTNPNLERSVSAAVSPATTWLQRTKNDRAPNARISADYCRLALFVSLDGIMNTTLLTDPQWALSNARVPSAWGVSQTKGQGTRIAIIGMEAVSSGRPGSGRPDEAALRSVMTGEECAGFTGVAPAAAVESYPQRSLGEEADATGLDQAVEQAIAQECDILLFAPAVFNAELIRKLTDKALRHGLVSVSAAGSGQQGTDLLNQFPDLLVTAGSDVSDQCCVPPRAGERALVAAPSKQVWYASAGGGNAPGKLTTGDGTLFGAAITAAIASLWISHNTRAALVAEAKNRGITMQRLAALAIHNTARTPNAWDVPMHGAGIIDAEALLRLPIDRIPDTFDG